MIKRRFYHVEHGDGDSASSSSSSDSEEFEPEERGEEQEENDQRVDEKEEEEEEKDGGKPASENPSARSSSSGYESEDSSGNEINCDSTGLLVNDYGEDSGKEWENLKDNQAHDCHPEENKRFVSNSITKTVDSEDSLQAEMSECILKCKSVFKCRICPRIVCLSEDTLLAHLKSKMCEILAERQCLHTKRKASRHLNPTCRKAVSWAIQASPNTDRVVHINDKETFG